MTIVSEFEGTIRTLRDGVEGEVCSRSRVMDGLLDLRLEAASRPDLVELIDSALEALPGINTVPAAWWTEQLDLLELAALDQAEPVG